MAASVSISPPRWTTSIGMVRSSPETVPRVRVIGSPAGKPMAATS